MSHLPPMNNVAHEIDENGIPVRPNLTKLRSGVGAHAAAAWIEYLESRIELLESQGVPEFPPLRAVGPTDKVRVDAMAGLDVAISIITDDSYVEGSEFGD